VVGAARLLTGVSGTPPAVGEGVCVSSEAVEQGDDTPTIRTIVAKRKTQCAHIERLNRRDPGGRRVRVDR
jgi:hypothetical protein